jgi:capsule polysaccharide export protein KpsE/RkpR
MGVFLVAPLSKIAEQGPQAVQQGDASLPRKPFGFQPTFVTEAATSRWRGMVDWFWRGFSFWTVVPLVGIFGFAYLFLFADNLYDSQALVTLQTASSASSSLSSLMGSSLLGGSTPPSQSGALIAYVQSHEMLSLLDKKFHLRQVYSAPGRNPFWRLASDASDADFLTFYQGMVTITQDQTSGILTINVLDYDANRAKEMQQVILTASEKFINDMSDEMRVATVKYAQQQFAAAMKAVETAQPYQQAVAEAELAAAQQGMASASGLANQQQLFLVPVSSAVAPTDTTYPDRLVDEAAVLLAASVFFMIGYLLLSNVRDHRRV